MWVNVYVTIWSWTMVMYSDRLYFINSQDLMLKWFHVTGQWKCVCLTWQHGLAQHFDSHFNHILNEELNAFIDNISIWNLYVIKYRWWYDFHVFYLSFPNHQRCNLSVLFYVDNDLFSWHSICGIFPSSIQIFCRFDAFRVTFCFKMKKKKSFHPGQKCPRSMSLHFWNHFYRKTNHTVFSLE